MGEVGQDVISSSFQGSGEGPQFGDAFGDVVSEGVDYRGEFGSSFVFVGVFVGLDDRLVDTPDAHQRRVPVVCYDLVDLDCCCAFEETVTS